jgi:hypothetical protein
VIPPGNLEAWRSPRRLPFALDPITGYLGYVELDETAYGEASFLDERLLAQGFCLTWAPWSEAARAAAQVAGGCDFIFHIGHVGSTLMSRLLGALDNVFSLREPTILRALAQDTANVEARLGAILPLLSRTWRQGQRSLIKTTSFVNVIAAELMASDRNARALLMFSAPQAHIAGVLAGEGSRRDMIAMAPARLARLNARLGSSIAGRGLSPGELAALAWACEIVALADLSAEVGPRAAWLDFDRFLTEPRPGLVAVLTHLRGEAPAASVERMMNSPDFGRYAKDQTQAYDPALRRQVLSQAFITHAAEINRGVAWLNGLGTDHGDFAQAARAALAGRLI